MVWLSVVLLPMVFPGCLNGLFYHPDRRVYRDLGAMPRCEQFEFDSTDGTRLHGCRLRTEGEPRGTVVYFHGNAQNVSSHIAFVDWLPAHGFEVIAFDYRGYGRSQGAASRSGLHEDSRAALAYAAACEGVDAGRLLVFAQSLGGACATAALGSDGAPRVRGLALDSTFESYIGMGNATLGGTFLTWPLAWLLLTDTHSPGAVIASLAPTPLLFFHGERDPVVPISQGRALFDAAREPKEFVAVDADLHPIATYRDAERERLLRFFEACLRD